MMRPNHYSKLYKALAPIFSFLTAGWSAPQPENPSRGRLAYGFAAVLALSLLLTCPHALAGKEEAASSSQPPQARATDVIVQGKVFCSLKRHVLVPFRGVVTTLKVREGQRVKQGEVIARYRLFPDAIQALQRRLSPTQISDLKLQQVTLDKSLAALDAKYAETRQLAAQNMAPAQSVTLLEREMDLVRKQLAALHEKLNAERQFANDDANYLKEMLGGTTQPLKTNGEASLLSPIAGNVIYLHPDLREGAELPAGFPAAVVAVMDPMIMRAQVHEMEVVKIGVGEQAEVTLESIPGRTFEGKVSRLSWAPLTPGVEQPTYYEMEITLPNPDFALREGLKGQIVFRKSR